jgi:hypothetical protein
MGRWKLRWHSRRLRSRTGRKRHRTFGAFRDGMKLLNPIHPYTADAEAAEGMVQGYWIVLHGNLSTTSEPDEAMAWLTNGIWGAVCVKMLRKGDSLPKPGAVLDLCRLEGDRQKAAKAAKAAQDTERKALPADATVTPGTSKIRAENRRLLHGFRVQCTEWGNSLIGKHGVRDRCKVQAEREGHTGDLLRLRTAILYTEQLLTLPRPTMPIFLRDSGYPNPDSAEKAERWNSKADLDESLMRLRAEWAVAAATEMDDAP